MYNESEIRVLKPYLAICFAIAVLVIANVVAKKEETTGSNGLTPAVVTQVVDGDTIKVQVDKKEETIRMIGVNTPESVSPDASENCAEGEVASDFTKEQLPPGTKIYLEYDQEKTDQYGRTLAYIWLSDKYDRNSKEAFCKYNYGEILLQNTYCEAVYYEPNGRYKEWYEELEQEYQPIK